MYLPKQKIRIFQIVLLTTTLLFAFLGTPYLSEGVAKEGEEQDDIYDQLKVFTDVLAIVQRDYVEKTSGKELVEGAIKGMLAQLDPHSGYLDPDFYQDLQVQTKGEFGGLGIEITIRDGLLVIVSPMEGSPAEKAGLRAGDTIVKIEGKFTKEYSLVDAVKKLRGAKGTKINISVQREGVKNLIEVTLIRDKITVKSVRSRYLGDGFGLVRVNQFMERTSDDIKMGLARMAKQSPQGELKGLVLDLRNNPGGLLTQAIRVSDLFLRSGVIVYTDGRVKAQRQKFFAHERDTQPDYPMIILVNGGSASASEIVAGALKDHGRAVVLGTQTFGKGSVQTITPLSNGGAVTLTTALYYTKSGNSLQATGVKPDIIMPVEENQEPQVRSEKSHSKNRVREQDLPGAIENPTLKNRTNKGSMQELNRTPTVRGDISSIDIETTDLEDIITQDDQLRRALDLLKTFNIFGNPKNTDKSLPEAA